MKVAFSMLLGLALVLALALTGSAEEKKEVTLKGDVCCLKCCLKEADKCHTVIKVKEKGKDVVYLFDDAGSKKYHKPICTTVKKGTVKGTVSEKEGKKIITVTEVKFEE
jgi:hypothetical protein